MKARFIRFGQLATLCALPVLGLLTSGCATPELWNHTAARDWTPQPPPDQFLATTTAGQHDVVVVFHQATVPHDKLKKRLVAWRLSQSPEGVAVGPKAMQLLTNSCERIETMPVYSPATVSADATCKPPGYAVWDPSVAQFTVYLEGCPLGPFVLPSSHQERNTTMRVVGMPFAIAADAAIVGAVCVAGASGFSMSGL